MAYFGGFDHETIEVTINFSVRIIINAMHSKRYVRCRTYIIE